MKPLAQILSSRVRARVFALLFSGDEPEYHLREIVRRAGMAVRTVQQDLSKLLRLDLVVSRRDGNRRYFQANTDHPAYPDIRNLVQKMSGVVPLLQEALLGHAGIEVAFIFGSWARQDTRARSDVDVMVIGEIGLRALTSLLSPVAKKVQREINPYVLKPKAFQERKNQGDHFVKSVLEAPKLFVVETERELAAMGRKPLAAIP